jgi:hypothetical protein
MLTQVITPELMSKLTYTINGEEYIYTKEYNKTKTGYIGSILHTEVYPIETEINNTYSYFDEHFSYIDKDGFERTFNKLETLRFDEETNSYKGVITEVEYIDNKIEIFEE